MYIHYDFVSFAYILMYKNVQRPPLNSLCSKTVFPNLWPHGQNGTWQISGGPQKFYNFYWATRLICGPHLIEWSIELLLTTSP